MHEILKKLQVKENIKLTVSGLPKELIEVFSNDNCIINNHKDKIRTDSVLFFVQTKNQIKEATLRISNMTETDAFIWFAYPKKSSRNYTSEVTRDEGWEALGALNLEPVRQISISEDWSALRFRRVENIKSFKRNFAISDEGRKRMSK